MSFQAIRTGSGILGFHPCWCPPPFPSPSISRCFSFTLLHLPLDFIRLFFIVEVSAHHHQPSSSFTRAWDWQRATVDPEAELLIIYCPLYNLRGVLTWLCWNRYYPNNYQGCFLAQPLSKQQSNCDSIQYYEVLYQKQGLPKLESILALQSANAINITGLDFGTEYGITLVAHNNQPLDSSSGRRRIITVSEREKSYTASFV